MRGWNGAPAIDHCPVCALAAPWAGMAFAARRWMRAGGRVDDMIGGRPSMAMVEAVLAIDAQVNAEEHADHEEAMRKAQAQQAGKKRR